MSKNIPKLHSHSGLEGILNFPKHIVLIDACFGAQVHKYGANTTPFTYRGKEYLKVEILDFVKAGGIFKYLME